MKPSISSASVVLPLPLSPAMAVIAGRLSEMRITEVVERDDNLAPLEQAAAVDFGRVADLE